LERDSQNQSPLALAIQKDHVDCAAIIISQMMDGSLRIDSKKISTPSKRPKLFEESNNNNNINNKGSNKRKMKKRLLFLI